MITLFHYLYIITGISEKNKDCFSTCIVLHKPKPKMMHLALTLWAC